jgi:hypothetical protein
MAKIIEPTSPTKAAEDALQDALEAIRLGSEKHGDTEPSFRLIAEMWTSYIQHVFLQGGESLEAHHVATMMTLLKVGRSVYGQVDDNYVDMAGYAALSVYLRR